ncbi:uncharacterized protein LOC126765313 [Bactrocera neohumeralis]|uniref:uncharacterized protein LOC126765313 n=1 Tax=Bactrocera neohumeralis TaxID=98809 RepID=UPI00216569B5|nr:uncharacterized protein LOC126765313 [Bactrocera neohumeralis]
MARLKSRQINIRMETFFIFLSPFVTAISSKNSESKTAHNLEDIKCRKQPAVGGNVLLAAAREAEYSVFRTVERISNEMDIEDIQITPKTVKSAISAPRASAPPIAVPRTRRVLSPPRQSSAATLRDTNEDPFEENLPPRCSLCHRPHVLKRCTIFKSMKTAQRQQIARAHGHCMSCLADSHTTFDCPTDESCQYCQRPHHTLVHRFPRRVNPPATHINNRHSKTRILSSAEEYAIPGTPGERTRDHLRQTTVIVINNANQLG